MVSHRKETSPNSLTNKASGSLARSSPKKSVKSGCRCLQNTSGVNEFGQRKATTLSRKVLRSKEYTKLKSSHCKCECSQIEVELKVTDGNITIANTSVNIVRHLHSPHQSEKTSLSQLSDLTQLTGDNDIPFRKEVDIPPTPGSGLELRVVNLQNIDERSKLTQTRTIQRADKSTITINSSNVLVHDEDLSSSFSIAKQDFCMQTENVIDELAYSMSQNDIIPNIGLTQHISDLSTSDVCAVTSQQLYDNLNQVADTNGLATPFSQDSDSDVPPKNANENDIKLTKVFVIYLKSYINIQASLSVNINDFIGANIHIGEIYNHLLDRIILLYNSLVISSVMTHDYLLFDIGKVCICLEINRNIYQMCEPDQEFLNGLCFFCKQISIAVEENAQLQ